MGLGFAASTLVHLNDLIDLRVEITTIDWVTAEAWPSMYDKNWDSMGIATDFPVHGVNVRHLKR